MIEVPAISNPTATISKTLTATALNQDYQLFIALPNSYTESEQRYPVLYVLDANGLFSFARMIVETQRIFESLPEMIIVGIGYPVKTYVDTATIRGRDLTLSELTPEEKAGQPYPYGETGKGPEFYAFLRDDVIPTIDREFRTHPDDRALAGWSLSGGVALYASFQTPPLFHRILSISGWVSDIVEEAEKGFASQHTSLPVKLFLCIERPQHVPEEQPWINLGIEYADKWIKRVQGRNYDGFRAHFSVIENADHGQVVPIGLAYGLMDIYRD